MAQKTCPICAGPLDADGLCPGCIEGTFDSGPALSADGTLATPGRPPPPQAPAVAHAPPPVPAPDPSHGVPLELDLPAPRASEASLELDERALAPARSRGAGVVIPAAPVEHVERPRRRRWPWVLGAFLAGSLALVAFAGAAGYRLADGLLQELVARLPALLPGESSSDKKGAKEETLAPGLAGEVLVIDSVPGGAQVFLGDELLGITPLAVDNPYDDGERFEVTVKKPGYLPARVVAEGGGPAHLEVTLERARRN